MTEYPNHSADLPKQGPGMRLQLARKAQRLSVPEIAQKLRLSPERIAMIENDDYRSFQSVTFARGYLRSYARLLNVPEQEVLTVFDQLGFSEKIVSNPPKLFEHKEYGIRNRSFRWLSYLILLALLGLVAIWLHGHFGSALNKSLSKQFMPNTNNTSEKSAALPETETLNLQPQAEQSQDSTPKASSDQDSDENSEDTSGDNTAGPTQSQSTQKKSNSNSRSGARQ